MKLQPSTLCFLVGAWIVLTGVAFLQRSHDMELVAAEIHRVSVWQARGEARLLALKVQEAKARARTDLDEVIASPVVFEMMERGHLRSCAVLVEDRLLEAQTRKPDGTLAPLAELPEDVHGEWSLNLREGDEIIGRVWVELDPAPWQARMEQVRSNSLWYFVAISQAGCLLLFVLLWFVRGMWAKKESHQKE